MKEIPEETFKLAEISIPIRFAKFPLNFPRATMSKKSATPLKRVISIDNSPRFDLSPLVSVSLVPKVVDNEYRKHRRGREGEETESK